MNEWLIANMSVVLVLGLGALLIALFPILRKESRFFAWFSLVMGVIVWLLLIWFTFGNEVIRYSIFHSGMQ